MSCRVFIKRVTVFRMGPPTSQLSPRWGDQRARFLQEIVRFGRLLPHDPFAKLFLRAVFGPVIEIIILRRFRQLFDGFFDERLSLEKEGVGHIHFVEFNGQFFNFFLCIRGFPEQHVKLLTQVALVEIHHGREVL